VRIYEGRNVVKTNRSSINHGRKAELHVDDRGGVVILERRMSGGNGYAIELDKTDTVPELTAQLITYCPKESLPKLLAAIGELLVRND